MDFRGVDEGHPDDEKERGFTFFYNREERLKKAPQSVRDFYAGKMTPKKGLFKVLVSTKGNRFMLMSIAVFVAFIWIFSFLSARNISRFIGTECELTAFSYEDSVYVSLQFKALSDEKLKTRMSIPVLVTFNAYDNSGALINKSEVSDSFTGEELFIRTKFTDYDIIKITASCNSGTESKDFSVNIQNR